MATAERVIAGSLLKSLFEFVLPRSVSRSL